ncbi:MAG: alpha/beta hydrolase [Promethearchaeota archaeon]
MKLEIMDLSFLDQPEILRFVFYPRRPIGKVIESEQIFSLKFPVTNTIYVGGRFYLTDKKAPILLFFHGNGEMATDYDSIAPLYQQIGVNFYVTDFRGYGISNGSPSFSKMIQDAHTIYNQLSKYLASNEFSGSIGIMGRSLGSASALELVSHYQNQITCLIIESGFVHTYKLLRHLGISPSTLNPEKEEDASLLPLLKKIRIPTLVIHGANDSIIPFSEGETIYNNISSYKKKFLIIPRAGHNDLLIRGFNDYMAAVENILSESANSH